MLLVRLKSILKLDGLRLQSPDGTGDKFHVAAVSQEVLEMAR